MSTPNWFFRNECHFVKRFDQESIFANKKPLNLIKLLNKREIKKIFHYARFDVAIIKNF